MDIRIGDVYTLRKPHPCGSYDWRVVRVGADIGMRCMRCDHKVMLPRSEFERRVKKMVSREVMGSRDSGVSGQESEEPGINSRI
jgi:hypothetical protein